MHTIALRAPFASVAVIFAAALGWPALVLGDEGKPPLTGVASQVSGSATVAPAEEPSAIRFQLLDEPVRVFQPLKPRTAADLERLQGYAWFCAGYLLERQRDAVGAYRAYQQALRHAPDAAAIYRQIFPIAFDLRRRDAAVRYVLKAVELEPSSYKALIDLGTYLARAGQPGDDRRALQLLEAARKRPELSAESPAYWVLMQELGRIYQRQGRYQEAADAFRVVLDVLERPEGDRLSPRELQQLGLRPQVSLETYGEVLLEAGRPQEALEAFRKAQQSQPDSAQLSYRLAQVYLKTERPAEALAELEKYLDQPQSKPEVEPYRLLADILRALGRGEDVIDRLENAVEAQPRHGALRYFLADQYQHAQQYEKAQTLYATLLAEDPKPEGYRGLAAVYRQTRRPEDLIAHLGRSCRDAQYRLEGLEAELKAIASDAELLKSLVDTARRLQTEKPEEMTAGSLYAVARIAALGGQVDAAAEFYRAALKERPEPHWFGELGIVYASAERFGEAAQVFREAIDKRVGPPSAFHFYLVRVLAFGGQIDEALKVAEEAVAIQDDPRNRFLIGWVYYYAQRWKEARTAYEKLLADFMPTSAGLDDDPGGLLNPLREAHFLLSNIYMELKDYDKAEQLLGRVLEDDPDDPHVNNDLGYLWADLGRNLAQAETMIRKAVEADPENPAYLDSLGWVLFKRDQYEEAAKYLQKAVERPEGADPVIWDHIGDVYLRLHQPEKAREAWEKALEMAQKRPRSDAHRIEQIRQKLKAQAEAGAAGDVGRARPGSP